MPAAEGGEVWTGPRLAARLVALNGAAPDPVQQVIFRSTRRADGTIQDGYHVPDQPQALDEAELNDWLTRHRLAGAERLAVAVLLINETLDARGLITQCTLERRRGSADGPYCGEPARVDFAGAASAVRLYRSHLDGRLTEVAPSADTPPPSVRLPEQFAGEHNALVTRFGDGVRVIDAREPTLFEDMVGLSSIVHVRTADGRDVGCGIGWHGAMAFVLEADFPRFATQLELLPEDAAAINAAIRSNGLVRGETRLDDSGIAVLARRTGGDALFLLRPQAGQVRVEPYSAGRDAAGTDQQRWMRYVESYEGLAVLDAWHDGATEDVIVLSGDPSGQIWQHHIDPDGVETWRKVSDDAAIGVLHREHLFPGTLAAEQAVAEEIDNRAAPSLSGPDVRRRSAVDSLLGLAEAYEHAMAALHDAHDAGDEPDAGTRHLRSLHATLLTLDAHVAAAAAEDLLTRREKNALTPGELAHELARIEDRLRDELALTRFVAVAPARARLLDRDNAPFGAEVAACFASASYDIEEAALCLALHRPTATVFHCMKIIERGIGAFSRHIGAVDPVTAGERNWQIILRLLRGAAEVGAGDLLQALDAIRPRWRGATLQPADKYTEEEAGIIFQAVGNFMRLLASSCDDSGRTIAGKAPAVTQSAIGD
jgi:hypothetical protein